MLHVHRLSLNSAPHLFDLCLLDLRHNGSYKGLFEVNLSMALCFKSLCVKIMRELRGKEIWLVFLFKPTFIPFFCDFWHVSRVWAWAVQLCFGSLCYSLLLSSVLPLVCSSSGLDLPLASQLESSTLCREHLMITMANFPDDFCLPGLFLLFSFYAK